MPLIILVPPSLNLFQFSYILFHMEERGVMPENYTMRYDVPYFIFYSFFLIILSFDLPF